MYILNMLFFVIQNMVFFCYCIVIDVYYNDFFIFQCVDKQFVLLWCKNVVGIKSYFVDCWRIFLVVNWLFCFFDNFIFGFWYFQIIIVDVLCGQWLVIIFVFFWDVNFIVVVWIVFMQLQCVVSGIDGQFLWIMNIGIVYGKINNLFFYVGLIGVVFIVDLKVVVICLIVVMLVFCIFWIIFFNGCCLCVKWVFYIDFSYYKFCDKSWYLK